MAILVLRNGKSSAYAAYLTTDDNPKEKERSDDHNDNSPNPYSCRLGFSFSAGYRPDPENTAVFTQYVISVKPPSVPDKSLQTAVRFILIKRQRTCPKSTVSDTAALLFPEGSARSYKIQQFFFIKLFSMLHNDDIL